MDPLTDKEIAEVVRIFGMSCPNCGGQFAIAQKGPYTDTEAEAFNCLQVERRLELVTAEDMCERTRRHRDEGRIGEREIALCRDVIREHNGGE